MRRWSFLFFGMLAVLLPALALGQTSVAPDGAYEAVISGPTDITIGRTIVLDASLSTTRGEDVQYTWYLGEGAQPISRSVEALFTPEQPGELTFRLVVEGPAGQRSEAVHRVTVYRRKVVLVADPSLSPEKLALHQRDAAAAGTFLRILRPPEQTGRLGSEDALVQLFSEQRSAFIGAEAIVLWSDDSTVLQALLRSMQSDPELLAGMRNQTIVLITGRSLPTLARTARGPFTVLQPEQILVTRSEAINPLINLSDMKTFLEEITRRDIDVLVVDTATTGLRPWNILSWLVNEMRIRGVSSEAVILLLVLPFIATIIAFLKQIVGITTFGLYTPSIIALSFLALGWAVGLACLLLILVAGYGTRAFMRRWRLLYIPKVAIILTVVSLTLLLLLAGATYFGVSLTRDTVVLLLIMSTLTESFLNLKAEEGWYSAILGISETVAAALLCVLLVRWSFFQSLIIAYPELVLLTIVVNAALGRWTGLRVLEYFRFREVFRHLQEEE